MIINLWKFILIILVLLFVLTNRLVYIKKDKNLNENKVLNNFVNCKIIDVSNYDLIGEIQ